MPTQVTYGGKSKDGSTIVGLKDKILQPALTSHFEVEIPVGDGNLKSLLEGVVGSGTDGQRTLNINCSESSLPGSSIATFEINNDHTGVTERYAHRRMYDDRIDFTFYVDAEKYTPIRFFERWMRFVTGEAGTRVDASDRTLKNVGYHYRMNFPKEYRCEGLKIKKFERDYKNSLEYTFVGAYPISVASMPVSYDSSGLLKCTVSMTYLRYVITELVGPTATPEPAVDTQKADQENTQEPPVAQENASDVQQNVIQNTGPEGEGSYDSASGGGFIRTEDQLYSKDAKVGDKVVGPLAKELQDFARGN
tara:strand:+ start:35 stop:955 length:921 start_codon:yes stop_codon:yes gene_type:complete